MVWVKCPCCGALSHKQNHRCYTDDVSPSSGALLKSVVYPKHSKLGSGYESGKEFGRECGADTSALVVDVLRAYTISRMNFLSLVLRIMAGLFNQGKVLPTSAQFHLGFLSHSYRRWDRKDHSSSTRTWTLLS